MNTADKELLDDIFLQPWFLPLQTAFAIKRILPPEHRHRMRFYFDDYGCLKCGKTGVAYGSNALCKLCMQQVKLRLFFAIKRRWTAASPDNLPRTFTRMADAQRLLKDLLNSSSKKALKKRNAPHSRGLPA
jgi:hypothetical protein